MSSIAAVIFVGGKARRLNGMNKADLMIGRKTCLEWTLESLTHQVEDIVLNVGQNDRYGHAKNHDIIFDWQSEGDREGTAFAILGSLSWAKQAGYDGVITTPVDTPLLPPTFAPTLILANDGDRPSVYKTSEGLQGLQGLHAIWPVSCFDEVKNAVLKNGVMKISSLHDSLNSKEILISAEDSFRFTNVNDENDVRIAEQYLVS